MRYCADVSEGWGLAAVSGSGGEDSVPTVESNPKLVGVDLATSILVTLPVIPPSVEGKMLSSKTSSTASSISFPSFAHTTISRLAIVSLSLSSSLTRAYDEREESAKRVGTTRRMIGISNGRRAISIYELQS